MKSVKSYVPVDAYGLVKTTVLSLPTVVMLGVSVILPSVSTLPAAWVPNIRSTTVAAAPSPCTEIAYAPDMACAPKPNAKNVSLGPVMMIFTISCVKCRCTVTDNPAFKVAVSAQVSYSSSVGVAVGDELGTLLGEAVGSAVVGDSVGGPLGDDDGVAVVGDSDGALLGDAEGLAVTP